MKNYVLAVFGLFILVLFSSVSAQVQSPQYTITPSAPAFTSSPTPTLTPFSPEHLKGAMGVGIGATPLGATALALRFWMEDNTALDIMLSGSAAPGTGLDFSGNEIVTSNWSYGLSLGLKQNLKEPVRDVFIQGIARLGYAQSYGQSTGSITQNGVSYGYTNFITQNQEVNLFLGVGFEAFVPFWTNLSIEGNVGLSTNAIWNEVNDYYNPNFTSNPDTKTSYGLLNTGFSNNTFSILSGAVHFYF